jgi:serine/threonine-protein kinase HipA
MLLDFFRLTASEATAIYDHVLSAVKDWRAVATKGGISRREQTAKQDALMFEQ